MLLENLDSVPEYVSGTKDVPFKVRLSSNENNYGPSPKVIRRIKEISKETHKYPNSSYYRLKEVLADFNSVLPSNIILGNGSDEIFLNLFLIFLNSQSSLVTIERTFTYYKIVATMLGAKVIEAKRGDNFAISCENILSSVDKTTRIIIFPSPDNPTGVITTRECIERILKNIPENTLFILDEAYFQFVPKDKYWDSVSLVKKYPNFIVTRTFSKLYGLAGVRLGYGICDESITRLYEKVRMPFNISLVAMESGIVALSDVEYYSKVLDLILKDKEKVMIEFEKMGIWVLKESYANFLFIRAPKDLDRRLLEYGIVIRSLKSFGYDNEYYRITIGKSKENEFLLEVLPRCVG